MENDSCDSGEDEVVEEIPEVKEEKKIVKKAKVRKKRYDCH